MQRIIISATNDLVSDQRIKKICRSLVEFNFEIVLIGCLFPGSLPLERSYKTIRIKIIFKQGFLFYAEFNIRLFFILLFSKKDILLANDLDTLLPNYLIGKLQSKKIIYDSHELFTEVPELIHRPKVQNIWLFIEKHILPKLKNAYTVNNKIASIYKEKYNTNFKIIRNYAPELKKKIIDTKLSKQLKSTNKMLILQGSGINIDRGAEEAVMMMRYLDHCVLYIIGGGDVFDKLKELIKLYHLDNKVIIMNKIPYYELLEYTKIADLGLSLDKDTNLNYEYSLPNKVFDYIQCQIPILTSNRPLVASLVKENQIGRVSDTHDPEKLAKIINSIFNNKNQYSVYKENLKIAARKYTWENESKKLLEIYSNIR